MQTCPSTHIVWRQCLLNPALWGQAVGKKFVLVVERSNPRDQSVCTPVLQTHFK